MLSIPASTTKPICPFFYECGGCESQDVLYSDQVAYKDAWLRLLFEPLLNPETIWKPFVHSSEPYPIFFRNKIRFSFIEKDGIIYPSRHRKGEDSADIPVDMCFLHSQDSVEIMNFTARFAQEHAWSLYDPKTSSGWLKHLLIRQSKSNGKIMLSLVTDDAPIKGREEWLTQIQQQFPMVSSLWHTVSWGKSNAQLQDTHLWGDLTLVEQVGEYFYHISPQSFFQTNGSMVTTLYETIRETAHIQPTETLWDLYAGSATIGIYMSNQAKRVVGIESNPTNCQDALANITLNNCENVAIVQGTVEEKLSSAFIAEHGPADIIILDPPRAGLHTTVKRILPHVAPHRLVYVSCNPLTCVRDIKELQRAGYKLRSVQGVDMFPHTWHCEVVTELVR